MTDIGAEIREIRAAMNFSTREFGEAVGLSDAARTVSAWEAGHRNGEEYRPTGTALAAIGYLRAVHSALAHLAAKRQDVAEMVLRDSLPEDMR